MRDCLKKCVQVNIYIHITILFYFFSLEKTRYSQNKKGGVTLICQRSKVLSVIDKLIRKKCTKFSFTLLINHMKLRFVYTYLFIYFWGKQRSLFISYDCKM